MVVFEIFFIGMELPQHNNNTFKVVSLLFDKENDLYSYGFYNYTYNFFVGILFLSYILIFSGKSIFWNINK